MFPTSRREFLSTAYNGLGALALSGMLRQEAQAATNPFAPKSPHLRRKAKNCIFLFMQGGVSQMDSFEYKPRLRELHGKPIPETVNILTSALDPILVECGHNFPETYAA